jgi:hypothetical protein
VRNVLAGVCSHCHLAGIRETVRLSCGCDACAIPQIPVSCSCNRSTICRDITLVRIEPTTLRFRERQPNFVAYSISQYRIGGAFVVRAVMGTEESFKLRIYRTNRRKEKIMERLVADIWNDQPNPSFLYRPHLRHLRSVPDKLRDTSALPPPYCISNVAFRISNPRFCEGSVFPKAMYCQCFSRSKLRTDLDRLDVKFIGLIYLDKSRLLSCRA